MHPAFLKPTNKVELGAFFISFVTRKWRYQISDYFGQYWHRLGTRDPKSYSLKFYNIGNRLTTRKLISEYFFRMVPNKSEHITFIIPPSIDEIKVKQQLQQWMLETSNYGPKLFIFSMLLPTNFYVAKFLGLLPANALFTYHIYRLNSIFRALYGSKRLQTLVDTNRVTFEANQDWENAIIKHSTQVTKELKLENINWEWRAGNDLHDDVVLKLQTEFKLPELIRTVRRTRLSNHVYRNIT